MKKIKWNGLLIILSLILSACAPPQVLYLTPGRFLDPVAEHGGQSQLVLQKFTENFNETELVGEHLIGSKKQILKIKPAKVSQTLDALLRDRFIAKGVNFKQGKNWDLSMEGLLSLQSNGGIVIGGRITRLSVKAKTGVTRLKTELELAMDVDCFIGVVSNEKIIRKSVYITEKVIKVSANQKAMEEVLDDFLVIAAQQVMINIDDPLSLFVRP